MLDLILALQNLPAARLLPSPNGREILLSDLLRLVSLVVSAEFDITSVAHLLELVVRHASDEKL